MSIASPPEVLPTLDLHYRSTPGLDTAAAMDAAIRGQSLSLSQAEGMVNVEDLNHPLLIVAAGSGAAQAFSCALSRYMRRAKASTSVLWCAAQASEIYDEDTLREAAELTVMIDTDASRSHAGLRWLETNSSRFGDYSVVISGAPGFVYNVTDILLEAGFTQDQLQSDVFTYAPR